MQENIKLKQRNLLWRWCAFHWKPDIIDAGRYTSAWSWMFAQRMVGNKEELLWLCVSIGASTTLEACWHIVDIGNERVEFHTLAILITNPVSKFTCFFLFVIWITIYSVLSLVLFQQKPGTFNLVTRMWAGFICMLIACVFSVFWGYKQ